MRAARHQAPPIDDARVPATGSRQRRRHDQRGAGTILRKCRRFAHERDLYAADRIDASERVAAQSAVGAGALPRPRLETGGAITLPPRVGDVAARIWGSDIE